MVWNRHSFVLSRPRGHRAYQEAQRFLAGVAELKVHSNGNRQAKPSLNMHLLFLISEFPPNLAMALNEIPNLLDRFAHDSTCRASTRQCAVARASASHAGCS